MIKRIAIIGLVALVAGCVTNNPSELREKTMGKYQLMFDENYQSVYRTIANNSRMCHESMVFPGTARIGVQADLYTDIREGTISVGMTSVVGHDLLFVIDVKYVEDNKSVVYISARTDGIAEDKIDAIEGWITRGSTKCNGQ